MISRILLALLVIGLWMRADAQNIPSRQVIVQQPGDADYTIPVTSTNIVTTTLTATRTWTLPAASSLAKGSTITITDLGGVIATPGNNIIIEGNSADTINGRLSLTLTKAYGSAVLMSNGSNGWVAQAQAADIPNAAFTASINQYGVVQGPLTFVKMQPTTGVAPGAGLVQIIATKGTNAGTCKLVALAGTSGTATTILDNIGGSFGVGGC